VTPKGCPMGPELYWSARKARRRRGTEVTPKGCSLSPLNGKGCRCRRTTMDPLNDCRS
jgi:hypothetical protein